MHRFYRYRAPHGGRNNRCSPDYSITMVEGETGGGVREAGEERAGTGIPKVARSGKKCDKHCSILK